jgi:hypothetical protein
VAVFCKMGFVLTEIDATSSTRPQPPRALASWTPRWWRFVCRGRASPVCCGCFRKNDIIFYWPCSSILI